MQATTFVHRLALAPGRASSDGARRWLTLVSTLVFFLAGWMFIAQQHALLWQRVGTDSVERFVADGVRAALPAPMAVDELRRLCRQAPTHLARLWPALNRKEIARCLSDPSAAVGEGAAAQALAEYETALAGQVQAAQAWIGAYDSQAAAQRKGLTEEMTRLQGNPSGLLGALASVAQRGLSMVGLAQSTATLEAVGPSVKADRVAHTLGAKVATTQALIADAHVLSSLPVWQRAATLGLAAAGLQWATDYGVDPPVAQFVTGRQTLADALEWQRRGQAAVARGFTLERLNQMGSALLAGAVLLVACAAVAGAPLGLWSAVTLLVGLGALMLTDLALTGEPALRYLAERQFLTLGSGGYGIDLVAQTPWFAAGSPLVLWWPFLLMALCILLLRLVRHGQARWLTLLERWADWGVLPWRGACQALALAAVGAAAVVALGMPAAVSELLIALACAGAATYAARQAAYASTGAGLQWQSLLVAGGALMAALALSLQRGDLGHALLVVALGACFLWLFGHRGHRWALAVLLTVGVGVLAWAWMTGGTSGPLPWLVDLLPPHAQERFSAMFDPFHADSSDLARTRWLMASAGNTGWGSGYVPWQGLATERPLEALPLQGPSDYVLALAIALWGRLGGLAVMAAILGVFGAAGVISARTTLRSGMPSAWRLLAATGFFGCVVMVVKVLLSACGVLGFLPLTGLPVALLGYGPVSMMAALVYLLLALGTSHACSAPREEGIHLQTPGVQPGAVHRRSWALAGALIAGVAVLTAAGLARLQEGSPSLASRHLALAHLGLAHVVAASLVPMQTPSTEGAKAAAIACPALANAAQAWDKRLGMLPAGALRLDLEMLTSGRPIAAASDCKALARTLGRMLQSDWQRLLRSAAGALETGPAAPLRPRTPAADPRDYSTPNAWWGLPGCTVPAAKLASREASADLCRALSADPAPSARALAQGDPWLRAELAPRLQAAVRVPTAVRTLNGREVTTGPVVGLSLAPAFQAQAQLIADCYTRRASGKDCSDVLPADERWRQQHFGEGGLRAGALGIVVAEVDSGRIVALAGAVSECSAAALQHPAVRAADGRMPALQPGMRCAQLPDATSRYLLTQHPALWIVGPGSSVKPLAALAGVESGLIKAQDDARWKSILAQSHEQSPVQAVALAAGARYTDLLGAAGFDPKPNELLWGEGSTSEAPLAVHWRITTRTGHQALRPTSMSFETMQKLRRDKEAGVNIDKQQGQRIVTEYLAARRLADASVGGADLRISAVGLVDVWRRLDLAAKGRAQVPALHLLEQPASTVARIDLKLGGSAAASRALQMTSGITSSVWGGTAQGSCRVVFGSCPAQGLPGLLGKTGTSDFLVQEDSPWVKDGLQIPAKLFGGVFAADGKRYAIAVMALRVREAHGPTLELTSSAPAEAALTFIRHIRGL